MVRYWCDCEFIDDGKTIDLISIGIVCEDGREYYAQSCEYDTNKANDWVTTNVLPHLSICPYGINHRKLSGAYLAEYDLLGHVFGKCGSVASAHPEQHRDYDRCPWRTRVSMQAEILIFMDAEKHGNPELWGWCAAYDFVALCQLFGTMMDLPQGYPHYIHDLQQVLDDHGISDDELPEQEEGKHQALGDARYIKNLWGYIARNVAWQ